MRYELFKASTAGSEIKASSAIQISAQVSRSSGALASDILAPFRLAPFRVRRLRQVRPRRNPHQASQKSKQGMARRGRSGAAGEWRSDVRVRETGRLRRRAHAPKHQLAPDHIDTFGTVACLEPRLR